MYKLLYFVTNIIGTFINMDYKIISDLAKMSYNVYYDINDKNWFNTTLNNVIDVSVSNDTVRAYLFTNNEKTNVVIAFKGTSTYWTSDNELSDNELNNNQMSCNSQNNENIFVSKNENMCMLSGGYSSGNDKYNDNLFFSCCFYKQSSLFENCNICNNICNSNIFKRSDNNCCSDCYKTSLEYKNNYINDIRKIIERVKTKIDFNKSKIYFTGHSLGGMLASIASLLYNKTGASFETPGDSHYIKLVYNKQNNNFYHFGHTADPIFMGNCGRTCSLFGYNINTLCHTGYTCLYDSKTKLGHSESIFNHGIEYFVKNIVPKLENDMPNCTRQSNCNDCSDWNFN
jgi:putative lipase involved disintegration of autophagic bodies